MISSGLKGLFVPALRPVSPILKRSVPRSNESMIFLNFCHLEVLCLSLKQTLQNGVQSYYVLLSKYNSAYSTAATRSPTDFVMALDAPLFCNTEFSDRLETLAETDVRHS